MCSRCSAVYSAGRSLVFARCAALWCLLSAPWSGPRAGIINLRRQKSWRFTWESVQTNNAINDTRTDTNTNVMRKQVSFTLLSRRNRRHVRPRLLDQPALLLKVLFFVLKRFALARPTCFGWGPACSANARNVAPVILQVRSTRSLSLSSGPNLSE